jgi:hypothetical protein
MRGRWRGRPILGKGLRAAENARAMSERRLVRQVTASDHVGMLGTLEWAAATGGRLRLRDRLRLVRDGMRARLAVRRHRVPSIGAAELRELARRPLPAGPLLAVAERACRDASEPWLVGHCLRTFVWGDLLAVVDGAVVDRDALLLAALLHDLGLTAAYGPAPGECFAVVGAARAAAVLREAGAGADLADRVGAAICLHLNPVIADEHGAVARYLQAGAAADVIGARQRELAACRDDVLAAHPRQGATRALAGVIRAQGERSPDTRSGWLCGNGFVRMIERAPFPE